LATSGYASTGRVRNEMTPQRNSNTATARTSRRLASEKSTSRRSISSASYESLFDGVLEHERVRDDALARLKSGAKLLLRAADAPCARLRPPIPPPLTPRRSNRPPPIDTYTQSRSWRCSTAVAGTTVRVSLERPWNVADTNMPMRRRPGLPTSMRTFAVRIVG